MNKQDFEGIKFEGEDYFKIGCRKCNSPNQQWEVLVNLDLKSFITICGKCGHITRLEPKSLVKQPDNKPISRRFLDD